MEADRYQVSHTLFIVGMISMLVCLALLAFSLFLFPYLIFNLRYPVPEFVAYWREWLLLAHGISHHAASWLILLCFFIPALCGFVISFLASNQIDNQIYNKKSLGSAGEQKIKWNVTINRFAIRLFFLVLLVILTMFLFEWLITTSTPYDLRGR